MSARRTFAVLHGVELSDDGRTETTVELERVELRGTYDWEKENPPPVLFDGQLYTEIPPHQRHWTPRRLADNPNMPTNELEIPYRLALVYDVAVDEIAERLYAPGEANELVERVREPLDQLVQATEGLNLEAEDEIAVSKARAAAVEILEQLAPPAEIELLNLPGDPAEISVLVDNRDADGRWVCTAERPWRAELGRAVHPSAVSDGSGDDYDAWACPHCKLGFRTTVGD